MSRYDQNRRGGSRDRRYERYPESIRNRRRKARRRARRLRRTAAVLFVIALALCLKHAVSNPAANRAIPSILETIQTGGLEEVYEQAGDAADTLRTLVKNNPETADFVRNYMEKKDHPPAQTVGEITPGVIPLLLQWDERWGYQIYGDQMIAVNGCGPTVISMVASGLTGDQTITPYRVAQFAAENGYYEGEAGTSWALMTDGAQYFGIRGEELGLSEGEVFSALESGCPIICSMRPGDFTTVGHFIVLVGTEGGKIRVNDPNSVKRSEKLWDYETLEPQINNLWAYSL